MIISYKGLTILYIYTLLINTLWFTVTRLERYFNRKFTPTFSTRSIVLFFIWFICIKTAPRLGFDCWKDHIMMYSLLVFYLLSWTINFLQLGTILIFHCSCLRKTNRLWYHCFQLLWWILPSIFLIYWMWNSESDNLSCSNWYSYTNCYYRGCHNPILPISSCEIVIIHKRSGFEEFLFM